MAERGQHTRTEAMRSITRALPAMLRAVKVLKRSADVGLGDRDPQEIQERCETLLRQPWTGEGTEGRLGDLLLAMAGLARCLHIDPEIALNEAVNRFIDRFEAAEREITKNDGAFGDLTEETLRNYWNSVKL